MKLREKSRVSPLMKGLIVTEVIAVILLLVLTAYKHNLGGIDSLFEEEVADVLLDAGHGGYDAGALDGDLQEKDITLSMVKKMGAVLEAKGYKVAYTRYDDDVDWADNESDDVKYRVATANKSGAKLFVSVHINSEEVAQGSYGYEVWGKLKKDHVFTLAKNMLDSVSSLGYSQNRGMKDQDTSSIYILEHCQIPAVLFEAGFIGSAQDQAYLKDGTAQQLFAEKMAEGIINTLEQLEQEENEKS